jgi:hypothetical protein
VPTKRKTMALYPDLELEKKFKVWMRQRNIESISAALCTFLAEHLEENSFETLSGRIRSLEQRVVDLEAKRS